MNSFRISINACAQGSKTVVVNDMFRLGEYRLSQIPPGNRNAESRYTDIRTRAAGTIKYVS